MVLLNMFSDVVLLLEFILAMFTFLVKFYFSSIFPIKMILLNVFSDVALLLKCILTIFTFSFFVLIPKWLFSICFLMLSCYLNSFWQCSHFWQNSIFQAYFLFINLEIFTCYIFVYVLLISICLWPDIHMHHIFTCYI